MDSTNLLQIFNGQNVTKTVNPPSENVTVENYLGNCNTQKYISKQC